MSNLNALLDKTSDWDKDERCDGFSVGWMAGSESDLFECRYMATNDLIAELQKDIKIDATMERRCVSLARGCRASTVLHPSPVSRRSAEARARGDRSPGLASRSSSMDVDVGSARAC